MSRGRLLRFFRFGFLAAFCFPLFSTDAVDRPRLLGVGVKPSVLKKHFPDAPTSGGITFQVLIEFTGSAACSLRDI